MSRELGNLKIHMEGFGVNQALTDAQSVKLFAAMRQIVFRGVGGILGLFAAIAAVIEPILFIPIL
jgi:hypothetical protein